jgi:CheY-like chemotaxis protein
VAEPGSGADELVEFLHVRGIQVFTAPDGTEAMEELRLEVPDAMLLDATAPSVGAVKLLERIRGDRAHQGLPVVAWTASSMPPQVRTKIEDLATAVVPAEDVLERLPDVLAKIFPSFEAEEAGT